MEENYLYELNEAQRKAVRETEGALLVLAGAGAGKTKTVAYRILHLVKKGVAPEEILAVTFTNKAAREMQERIFSLLEQNKDLNRPISFSGRPFISTFHSLGVFIIKENAKEAGLTKHFSIYDRSDSKRAVKEALLKHNYNPKEFEPGKILSIISKEKGNFLNQAEYEAAANNDPPAGGFGDIISRVWKSYDEILKKENALDFDDLLLVAAKLLQKEEIRKKYSEKWKYIHVDEYQDTNKVQYSILEALARDNQNICVVGDVDQCLVAGTKISIAGGNTKLIEDIKEGDRVLSNYGGGDLRPAKITRKTEHLFNGELVHIKTKNGKTVTSTSDHIHFAGYRLGVTPQLYFNYLMHKKEIGWRLGTTQVYTNSQRKPVVGFIQRCNQEHADAAWVIAAHHTPKEARVQEYILSLKYQIPTLPFVPRKSLSINGYVHDKMALRKIFSSFDTDKHAARLLRDFGLPLEHSHYRPQTRNANRRNINITLCADKRGNTPMHLVSMSGNDLIGKKALQSLGLSVRPAKKDSNSNWRFETVYADYLRVFATAKKIYSVLPDSKIIFKARLGGSKTNPKDSNSLPCIPASAIMPGMALFTENGYDVVSEVSRSQAKNLRVFDVDVDKTHNFSANGILTHNCIYSWRGASIRNILNFEKDYRDAKMVVLEENYRSTQTILAVANRVIAKNKMRREKNLFTQNAVGDKIGVFEGLDETHEARYVVLKIKELQKQGAALTDMAVLYRANFQSRALEEACLAGNLPYQVLGTKFFERKEIKDILSYLRLSFNPASIADLKRIINTPARGIGKTTLLKIVEGKEEFLPIKMKIKIASFRKLLSEIKEFALRNPPSKTISFIARKSGILDDLEQEGKEEAEERKENIKELVALASRYDKMAAPTPGGRGSDQSVGEEAIEKFLEDAALATDQDSDKEEVEAVRLMTVHAAKGLEFSYVFLTGLEEGLFPHDRDNDERVSEDEAEEERRLFYVAVTRAKKKLFLSYAQTRAIFGSRGVNIPSEFLLEIPEEYLEKDFLDYTPRRKPLLHIEF